MTTLKELNEKVWYRFLKVIFILCFLPYFILLFFTFEVNQDYHDPILPNTVQETLKDPEFYKLNDEEMIQVISSIERDTKESVLKSEWKNFVPDPLNEQPYETQKEEIKKLRELKTPTTTLKNKYHYTSFYTLNVLNCIKYGLILTICYILVMECIRRGFYYIVIGKVFPKE